MTRAFGAAVVLWPALLAAALGGRLLDRAPLFTMAIYLSGGTVCHQNPARSFHTHGQKWPVCARCAGLYLAAPVGVLAAAFSRRRVDRSRELRALALAAAPTVITFVLEHGGLTGMSSTARFVAALPLGAAAAWVMMRAVRGPATTIG